MVQVKRNYKFESGGTVYRCKRIRKNGKPCNKLEFTSKRKEHNNRHKGAIIASAKNIDSERQYVFQTGTECGPPDIVMYKNWKLSFYEVKPTGKGNDSLLKADQAKWIKKNCLRNNIDVYVVRYKCRTKKFTFVKKKLSKKNISMYES